MNTYSIRRAKAGEGNALTELCLRSKSHWGYSQEFMTAFRPELIISEDYIASAPVFVAEHEGKVVGFSGLSRPHGEQELIFLFVEPEFIGKGCGDALWKASLEEMKKLGWKSVSITCDPHAEKFYLKKGAVRIGEKEFAVIPGRKSPWLRYSLDSSDSSKRS